MHLAIQLLLALAFGWSCLKNVELLLRGAKSTDRALYEHVDLGWLAVALFSATACLDAFAVLFLLQPEPIGFAICVVSIWLSFVESSVALAIAYAHPRAARRAWLESFHSRDLAVPRDDVADALLRAVPFLCAWLATLTVCVGLSLLVVAHRAYFG